MQIKFCLDMDIITRKKSIHENSLIRVLNYLISYHPVIESTV